MNENFSNHLFSERRYIASAPRVSSTAELSKSCGIVGSWMAGGGDAEIAGVRGLELACVRKRFSAAQIV